MATQLHNLSEYNTETVPSAENMSFGIVVAEWNIQITKALLESAYNTLIKHNATADNIIVRYVPGSFELTSGARLLAEWTSVDAIIVLGCVIQGETRHFDYICQSVTKGITDLNLSYDIPFIFGVLTTDNIEQALDRAGGKHGNKGTESAIAAIKMVALHYSFDKLPF